MIESIVAAAMLLVMVLVAYVADTLAGRRRLRLRATSARRWDAVYRAAQHSRRH